MRKSSRSSRGRGEKSRGAPGAEGKQADQSLSWAPPHLRTETYSPLIPGHPRTSAQNPPHKRKIYISATVSYGFASLV
ncbi:MAG: hypothetical protein BRC51_00195 [Cyanobacteria bacterium SW_12_48_29]|nr:MAG: hypothetical protein BRC51_00195 [Cyanobacteria bacterium SW_12_48_29]PSP20582.1 MAG: hypothetical protein BRC55_16850 [Cyanobacteria bacterium SW_8_48_13]